MQHLRDMHGADVFFAGAMLGRLAKVIDDDVQLLYLAGIALDRMEMQHCVEANRHRLMVDGKLVREYIITFTVDGEPVGG